MIINQGNININTEQQELISNYRNKWQQIALSTEPIDCDRVTAGIIDYCHSVLNCECDETKWNIFDNLITNCSWMFLYEKTAIVCQRPIKINLDCDNNSDRQNEAIIEFDDRFKIYDND